jgi:hypothetical protein
MSDGNRFGGLMLYYEQFLPEFLPLPSGEKRSRRSGTHLAEKYDLPLIKVGRSIFIDTELAALRLREAQLAGQEPRRGRGRPRKA